MPLCRKGIAGNGYACQFAKEVMMKKALVVLLVVCIGFSLITGCKKVTKKPVVLTVEHAGSLTKPIREVEDAFNKEEGLNVTFKDESHGSVAVVKDVSELHKLVDVVATADYSLIPKYLIPKYADWYIQFATNKLVIVYTEKSKFADEINKDNWYDILQRPGVEFGFSDPNTDPCGYRTRLMFKLANLYYKNPNIEENLVKSCPKANIKPKAVELVAQVQSGELDYAFEYLSVAVQNGLKYVELPDELNFSNPQYANFYAKATLTLKDGKVVQGRPIIYGITIPKNAPNKELAAKFIAFLLSDKGKEIFMQNGQPFVKLKTNVPKDELPKALQTYFK